LRHFRARTLPTALLAGILVVALSGCAKTPGRRQIRAVTAEVVNAAERVTGRKPELTIRPEFQASFFGLRTRLAADNIYISSSDPSQAGALRQALEEIARRHKLSFAEGSKGSQIRFDFSSHGVRTHSIYLMAPRVTRGEPSPTASEAPRLAIIVDDLGQDRAAADSVLALPFPLSASVLPHLEFSTQIAEDAFRRGDQVLLHCPMEAESGAAKQESLELRVGMSQNQVDSELAGMLSTVPHAAGLNNHEGSRATADRSLMGELMPDLRARGLFFVDSRTTAQTVAFDEAERAGVPAASRKVFLDDVPTRAAVLAQLNLAARDAIRNGSAIAIGHPREATIAALAEGVPAIEARGVRMVLVSDLVR
jgi:uncharacterized protein